jgi:hypothetical protein
MKPKAKFEYFQAIPFYTKSDPAVFAWFSDNLGVYELRLMPSVKEVAGIPTAGKGLIIVAVVDQTIHFRIFDGDGQVVVDTDEKKLTEHAPQIVELRKQLEGLSPPRSLTSSEKRRIGDAVKSIVGYTDRGELDAMTGRALPVIVPESVKSGDAADVYSAAEEKLDPDGKKRRRYPGLKRDDFPCLWIEGKGGKHFTLPIPKKTDEIPGMLRKVADAAAESNNIDELRAKISKVKGLPRPIEDRYFRDVVGLAVLAIALILIYLISLPLLPRSSTGILEIAILAVVALIPAVVLFKIVQSFAEFSGTQYGMDLKLGGAAAVWGLVFLGGIAYQRSLPAPGTFTAGFFFKVQDDRNTPMPTAGRVDAQLDVPMPGEVRDGFGKIPRLSRDWEGKTTTIILHVPGYELVKPEVTYLLSESKPPTVLVKRSAEVGPLVVSTFNCTIYFSIEGSPNGVVPDGQLTLQFNKPEVVPISQGSASISSIPDAWNDQPVTVRLKMIGYQLADPLAPVRLKPDGRINVLVRQEPPPKSKEEAPSAGSSKEF